VLTTLSSVDIVQGDSLIRSTRSGGRFTSPRVMQEVLQRWLTCAQAPTAICRGTEARCPDTRATARWQDPTRKRSPCFSLTSTPPSPGGRGGIGSIIAQSSLNASTLPVGLRQ
jgi:hypothetical protein